MAGLKLDFSAIRELGKAIAGTQETRQQTKKAVVREITDGGAVVEIAGSGVLTPVESSTATYSVGDVVTVSNRGGKLHIDGDVTAPSVGAGYVRKTVQPVVQAVAEATQTASEGVKAGADAQKVADEAKATAAATNQHFWADDNGVHVTEQTQEDWQTAQTGSNILINSLGLLLRKALHNLVSITASATAFFDGNGNEAENITARFGADGAQVGKSGESHMELDYHSLQTVDKEGDTYFHVSDLLDAEGYVTDSFESDGSTTHFVLSDFTYDTSTISVTVNDVEVTSGIGKASDFVSFDTAPSSGSVVKVKYTPAHGDLKAYTLGKRRSSYPIGAYSVVEGFDNKARAKYAHAEGYMTSAKEDYSHAQNQGTIAALNSQTAIGKYNDPSSAYNAAFVIGNGTSDNDRSNAFAVDWDGNVTAAGKVNGHAAHKTLWSGTWSSGTLKVDGISDYKMLEISFASEGTHAQCFVTGSGTSAYVRGSNSYTDGSSIVDYIVGLDLNMNTDTLTWVACKKRPMTISSKTVGTIANLTVTSIIGIL